MLTKIEAREFSKELQTEANLYFRERNNLSKKGNKQLYVKTAILLISFFLITVIAFTIQPKHMFVLFIEYIALGVLMAGIGMCVMHDGSHWAYSEKKWVNDLMGGVISVFSGFLPNWRAQHGVLHHSFTNIVGQDQDISGEPFLRFHQLAKWLKIHRYQKYYTPFLYSVMTLRWAFFNDFDQMIRFSKIPATKRLYKNMLRMWVKLVVLKIALFGFWIGLPVYFGMSLSTAIGGFLIMHAVGGFILANIFQLAHVHGEIPVFKEGLGADYHLYRQMLATQNFATDNKFLNWFTGGLNHQIEHHLFPTVSHVHYHGLQPIVQRIAKKHGIVYREVQSFWQAVREHYHHLGELGKAA